jgi:hypothetical protein
MVPKAEKRRDEPGTDFLVSMPIISYFIPYLLILAGMMDRRGAHDIGTLRVHHRGTENTEGPENNTNCCWFFSVLSVFSVPLW